jgi:hypothetical protein
MWLSHTRLVLSQRGGTPFVPHGGGAQKGQMCRWSPRVGGLVAQHVAGAQQGLKGIGLGGDRYPGELWDWLQAGVQPVQVAGIPVVVDLVA